jgi:DNA-binding NarL/FixJ family response regulator
LGRLFTREEERLFMLRAAPTDVHEALGLGQCHGCNTVVSLPDSRETEVLQLMTQGLSYKMVAAKLGITYNTVNAHVKKIYEKLSVNSLGEAVSVALRNKIV